MVANHQKRNAKTILLIYLLFKKKKRKNFVSVFKKKKKKKWINKQTVDGRQLKHLIIPINFLLYNPLICYHCSSLIAIIIHQMLTVFICFLITEQLYFL